MARDEDKTPQVRRPRYTLDELLAGHDPARKLSVQERDWLDAAPVGREILKD